MKDKKKTAFIRTSLPIVGHGKWRVAFNRWFAINDEPVTGWEVEEIITNDFRLAVMAAHRLLDVHAEKNGPFFSIDIGTADPAKGDYV